LTIPELVFSAAGIVTAVVILHRLARGSRGALWVLASAVTLFGALLWTWPPGERAADIPRSIAVTTASSNYVSSGGCRSCHPAEYRSWHDSHHRSMTEVATAASVRAPKADVDLEWQGHDYRLSWRGDELWARLPDPDRAAADARSGLRNALPNVERRVVMTTGSHHYQAYWLPGARGNELWQFPFVFHFESQRFIPRHDAFLQPPDDPAHSARWNSNCIQCHSVAGEPRHDRSTDRFETRVVELGIACEACHGPGAEHVRRHQNPITRYGQRRSGAADPSIVNPARLDAERASEVCGQCHAYFIPNDAERWWQSGFAENFRPGDALADSRRVLDLEADFGRHPAPINAAMESLFYADGTIRVGGREWNGLRQSACFEKGSGARQLSCLSCHQMHGADPDDQLKAEGQTNAVCQSCHGAQADRLTEHTHHLANSSGSQCVNCHMPYTTYALFKGIRSHRITRPSVYLGDGGQAPNACNLCHQDQSLAWTSHWQSRWYDSAPSVRRDAGAPPAERSPDGRNDQWSAAAVGLLSGDAATRVILAYQLGWATAQETSGRHWQAQLLAEALDDPYAAVRFVAHRSLLTLPGFEGYLYDFIAPRPKRLEMQREARHLAQANAGSSPRGRLGAPALPLDANGSIEPGFITRLLTEMDSRPIRISE
jgi:predicted CXXCH cytochrome family protein